MPSNKTFKTFVDKMGGTQATNYIGNPGELFYDPETTSLRISDGVTPGGSLISGGGGVTGNIVIASTESEINFVANSSGDGSGYSTIQLIPDTGLGSDQYIILDPTAPSHIHIRAGGEQDNSFADLFLGGEKNYVRVRDGEFGGVRLQNERTSSNLQGPYNETTDYINGVWYENGGSYYVQFTTDTPIIQVLAGQFTDNNLNRMFITYSGGSNTLFTSSYYGNPGSNTYILGVTQGPPANTTLTAIEFEIYTTNINELILESNDFRVEVNDDIRMYSKDLFRLYNYANDEPIEIITDYDNNSYNWSFQPDGMLQFPSSGKLNIKATEPATSNGASGDLAGMIAFSNTYMYYCIADYDGVTTDIWRRVAWSANTSW